MIEPVSREESVTVVDPGAESGRKRRDESSLGENVPGRGSSIGKERGAQGACTLRGRGTSGWQRGEHGTRTHHRVPRAGPGRNGETLQGFERGQAAIWSER